MKNRFGKCRSELDFSLFFLIAVSYSLTVTALYPLGQRHETDEVSDQKEVSPLKAVHMLQKQNMGAAADSGELFGVPDVIP